MATDRLLQRALGSALPDNVSRKVADAWLRVQLVNERASGVSALVLPPLLVLALLVVARSGLFDGWGVPIPLVAVLSVSFAICVLNAWFLHTSAEAVRRRSLAVLQECLLETQRSAQKPALGDDQIQTVVREIESLREGAFVAPWERPVVVAGLLPLLSAGGLQLFQVLGLSQ